MRMVADFKTELDFRCTQIWFISKYLYYEIDKNDLMRNGYIFVSYIPHPSYRLDICIPMTATPATASRNKR